MTKEQWVIQWEKQRKSLQPGVVSQTYNSSTLRWWQALTEFNAILSYTVSSKASLGYIGACLKQNEQTKVE